MANIDTPIWPIEGVALESVDPAVAGSLAHVALAIQTVTDNLPDSGAMSSISDETDKIDSAAATGLNGTEDSISYQVGEVDRHNHTRERWWGALGAPDETNAIEANVNRPFVATSGNNTWGTAIPICGTDDTAAPSGDVKFDADQVLVTDSDHATPYRIRFIWGTGTSGDAITAGQWSEGMFVTAAGPFLSGASATGKMRRVDVGTKLWVQVWNATNASTVSFSGVVMATRGRG